MATSQMNKVIQHLRRAMLVRDGAELTDGQLLGCFIDHRDEAAFAALVQRHGPMVWSMCRRVLANYHDAEDAFQATFLVLVRKAASVVPREMVANWLYGVAHQTALKARATTARRKERERQVTKMPEPVVVEQDLWRDLQPPLDQELSRLPDKYRVAIVLCDLEGKTRKEAARQLGCPEGTLAARLARARVMLAKRLARHGLAVSGGALAAVLSEKAASAGVPTSVVMSTIKAASLLAAGRAAGVISVKVAALTEGVLKTMLLAKLKIATAVLVLLVVPAAGTGVGLLRHSALVGQPSEEKREKTEPSATRPGPELPPASDTPRFARLADGKSKQSVSEPIKPGAGEPPVVFKNSPGWSWFEAPLSIRQGFGSSRVRSDSSGGGYTAIVEEDKDGALVVYLTFATSKSVTAYRPVAFDAERKRCPLKPVGGGSLQNVKQIRFRLDPKTLPASQADYLGIEILTAEGRKVRANDARDRAKKTGVEVLPFPEVGAVYEFVLSTMDGKIIRSRDLRGKVVLIDCWATWCSPCMAKMPQLKELYEQHRKDGLEIVGVCFDHEADKARKTIKSKGLDWPQVFVPDDQKMRGLWEEATGIEALPRLLLVDRSGVLRADCGPGELKDQLGKLLKETQAPDFRR